MWTNRGTWPRVSPSNSGQVILTTRAKILVSECLAISLAERTDSLLESESNGKVGT